MAAIACQGLLMMSKSVDCCYECCYEPLAVAL